MYYILLSRFSENNKLKLTRFVPLLFTWRCLLIKMVLCFSYKVCVQFCSTSNSSSIDQYVYTTIIGLLSTSHSEGKIDILKTTQWKKKKKNIANEIISLSLLNYDVTHLCATSSLGVQHGVNLNDRYVENDT